MKSESIPPKIRERLIRAETKVGRSVSIEKRVMNPRRASMRNSVKRAKKTGVIRWCLRESREGRLIGVWIRYLFRIG